MKKLIIPISILIICVGQAYGQTDSYRTTLKHLFIVSGSETNFKVTIKQMFTMLKQQKTNIPDSVWNEFENEFVKASIDELVDMLYPIYKKHMTENDLTKTIEFFETPIGKKYVEKTPFILQESMQVGQQWGAKIAKKIELRLKEKGY